MRGKGRIYKRANSSHCGLLTSNAGKKSVSHPNRMTQIKHRACWKSDSGKLRMTGRA